MNLSDCQPVAFYVARHGQTILNASGMFRGSANPPLDATGIKQAHVLAKLFSNIDISHIFCSDKQRATKTAEIISQAKNIPIHKSESLRALNVGDFSGTPRNKESEAELQTYLDAPDTAIPGGESLNDFKSRIGPCFQQAVDIFLECGVPPLIVGHSSIVHELGAVTTKSHKAVLVEPGGVAAAYFDGGDLKASPIFRPVNNTKSRAETIS